MKTYILSNKRTLLIHTLLGAAIGAIMLHPLAMLVYWFDFHNSLSSMSHNPWTFLVNRMSASYYQRLIPMTAVFGIIGSMIGLGFAFYHIALLKQRRLVSYLEHELNDDLQTLISRGEGERLEFKTSLRWDAEFKRINKALRQVIAKTVAGFMNYEGGTLLIGVNDNGEMVGIEPDFQTLKHKNADGFERAVMDTIRDYLGGNACALLHCQFQIFEQHTICRIRIEPSAQPVYFKDTNVARYMLRTGNATRELDVQEAQAHISQQKLAA